VIHATTSSRQRSFFGWLACERPFFGGGFEIQNTNGWGNGSGISCP
jgi:hypothetical protein